jgi:AraC-like DNA-binding protein
MRRATNSHEFRTAPVGRYVSGNGWVLWCTDPALCGSIVWGRLDEAAIGEIATPFDSLDSPQMAPRCALLTDASRLEGIDGDAFRRFAAFIGRKLPDLESRIGRQAIVRPSGLTGALVAGFYEVLGRPSYPVGLFTDVVCAARWLARPDAEALAEELAALAIAASSLPDEVRRLRELLGTSPHLSLAAAVRAMGVSERSLQRQLRRAGTSFRHEVDAARIRAARTLLADTDRKITAIALEVGCATLQHFSALFRRMTGETPSAWRARQRAVAST